MCGVVGIYNPSGKLRVGQEVLLRMRDKMTHRGPDGAGIWQSENRKCLLGHRRLSIIDLSDAAGQPMLNATGNIALVFNGEIYNHQEIREELEKLGKYTWKTDHSDTEVLLYAYEEWGLRCIDKLYGMFAFAVYDTRNKEKPVLHLVRDRVGIKPLYVAKTKYGEWTFASEIKALLEHPDIETEMEKSAFWHYLTFIVAPAPLTMFKGIFKIPAGHFVTIQHNGRAFAEQYWDCAPTDEHIYDANNISLEEVTDNLLDLLRRSIQRRMVSDVPFGVLLSGGVDSSLNVGLMSELMDRPVRSFTVGYDAHDDFNEFNYARKIAKRYNTEHYEGKFSSDDAIHFIPEMIGLQDEPIADNVCIPLYFLAKLVKDSGTTVVQVGEGADEQFLGYWWCDHYVQKERDVYDSTRKSLKWYQKVFSRFNGTPMLVGDEDSYIRERAKYGQELFWGGAVCWWGELRRKLTPDPDRFQSKVDCPVENLLPADFAEQESHNVVASYMRKINRNMRYPDVGRKIPYMELKLRLPEHLLMRVDKMTMAHSVEARVPFLDQDIVKYAMRIPNNYKLKDGVGKLVLKKVAEQFVDHDLVYRKKQGFGAPMEQWLKEDFGKKCYSIFQRSTMRKEKYFDNEYFESMFKQQMNSGGGYSFHVWTVLNAVLWYESWVNGKKSIFS